MLVKMVSTAQTGFFYVYKKNPKRTQRSAHTTTYPSPQHYTHTHTATAASDSHSHYADAV